MIGVLPANTRAAALYERRGYVPTWVTLTRFGRRHEPTNGRVHIEPVEPGAIDALAPLWHSLHAHHQAVAPALGALRAARGLVGRHAPRHRRHGSGRPGAASGPARSPARHGLRDDLARRPAVGGHLVTGRDVAETKLLVVDDGARGAGTRIGAPRCGRRPPRLGRRERPGDRRDRTERRGDPALRAARVPSGVAADDAFRAPRASSRAEARRGCPRASRSTAPASSPECPVSN